MGTYVRHPAAQTARPATPSPLQPTLFEPLPPLRKPDYQKTDTIEQRFNAFHAANPWSTASCARWRWASSGAAQLATGLRAV